MADTVTPFDSSGTLAATEAPDAAKVNYTGTVFYDATSNVALSNGLLTATKTSLGATADSTHFTADNTTITVDLVDVGYGGALSTSTRGATKVYAEVHLDNQITAHDVLVGICTTAGEPSGNLGQSLASYGWRDDGTVYHNNTVVSSAAPTYATGHWVAVAVDRTAGTAQFRNVTTNSAWSSAVSVSDITSGNVCLAVSVYQAPEAWTANFDGLTIGAAPSGYTRWDGSVTAQLAATGTLAATDGADTASFPGALVRWIATLASTEVGDASNIAGLVGRSGALVTTESGDAGNISGTVTWLGTLAATEGADTASVSGLVRWLGTLAATEAGDLGSISSTVTWLAALAATEANDTASIAGSNAWLAGLVATEVADASAISGTVVWRGTLAATEAADASAIPGGIYGTGTLASTEGTDTSVLSAGTYATGTLALTEVTDTASFPGALVRWLGTLGATEAADTASFPGALVRWLGTLAATESGDAASVSATVVWIGALAATEAADTASVNGLVARTGTLASTEVGDAAGFPGTVSWLGTLATSEAADTINVSSLAGTGGTLATTEAGDTASFPGALVRWLGTFASTEGADTGIANGLVGLTGSLASTEGPDAVSFPGLVRWLGTLAATDGADTAALAGGIYATGTLAATEGADTNAISGGIYGTGTLAATEFADLASVNVLVSRTGSLAATEAADATNIGVLVRWLGTFAATEIGDTAVANGLVGRSGTLAATDVADTASASGLVQWSAVLAATEAADLVAIAATAETLGTLATTEAIDSLFANEGVPGPAGPLAATDVADNAALQGGVVVSGTLTATDGADAASFPGGLVRWIATLAATEARDTSAILGAAVATGTFAATEASDVVNVSITPAWTGTLATIEVGDAAFVDGTGRGGTLGARDTPDALAFAGGTHKTFLFDHTPNVNLSNSYLTGSNVAGGATADSTFYTADNTNLTADQSITTIGTAFSQTTRGATQVYAEAHADHLVGGGTTGLGFGLRSENSWLGSSAQSYGWRPDGSVYHNGVVIGTVPTYVEGDWLAVAVNRTAGTAQFRNITANSAWSTPINVSDITSSDLVFGLSFEDAGEAWTANFDSAFLGATPTSAYTRWDGSPAVMQAVTGVIAAGEGADNATFSSVLAWIGSLVATEDVDDAAFSGLVGLTATLAANDGVDDATFSGTLSWLGSLAATELPDTPSFVGVGEWHGTLAASEVADTANFPGSVGWPGQLAATEDPDDATFAGMVAWWGSMEAEEGPDVSRGLGNPIDHVEIEGPFAVTEGEADTVEFDGRTSWDAEFDPFEDPDTASADGLVGWQHLDTTEDSDSCSVDGVLGQIGALYAIEAGDVGLVSGTTGLIGTLIADDAADAVNVSATVADTNEATFALDEQPDTASFDALIGWEILAATEVSDNSVISGLVGLLGAIAVQEQDSDICSADGILGVLGSLETQEAVEGALARGARDATIAEAAAIAGAVTNTTWLGTLAASEFSDIPYLEQAPHLFCSLVATEAPDRYRVNIDEQSFSFLIRDTLFNALARDPFFAGFAKGHAQRDASYYTGRKTKGLRVQPEQLPYIGVYIVDDIMVPDGDANAGHVRLNHTLRLGYSVIIANSDDDLAEQQIDAALKRIMMLLADPYIMNMLDTYNPTFGIDNIGNTLIESVPRALRRQSYGASRLNNETPIVELQFECFYFYREDFRPEIIDDLEEIDMTTGVKIGETEEEQAQRLQVKAKYKFTPEEMMAALKEAAE